MTITLFASTACVRPIGTFEEHISAFEAHGISNIEASFFPSAYEPEAVSVLEQSEAQVMIHNFFPTPREELVLNLASPNPDTLARTQSFMQHAIDLSVQFGCPWYSLHAGFAADPIGYERGGFIFPNVSEEELKAADQRFIQAVRLLSDYAQERSITLLLENNVCNEENRDKLLFVTPENWEATFSQLEDLPNVGMLLDTGHFKVSAATYDVSLESIGAVAEKVLGIHLHENDSSSDQHLPAEKGSWALETAIGFSPQFITMEARYPTIEALSGSYKDLSAILDEG